MKTLFTNNPTRNERLTRSGLIYLVLILVAVLAMTAQFILLQREHDRITAAQRQQRIQILLNRRLALEATRALCLRKDELRSEVKAGKSYLKQHPLGSSAIPLALIVKSIHDSETVLATLRDVRCRSG